ncbi:zinc finger, CCHC-type containing protein [Tanacetum coccineum]
MDVKTAFLNGKLDDKVYMNQPQGFIMPGNENKVDLTMEFLSSKFSLKDIREANKDTLMQARSEMLKTICLPVAGNPACCCAATLAKAYSQMYNRKSRHLGVRHSMIRELITNGVVFIEFVRSQQNLVDHLMKGLARDLVLKSTKGMGLKSNQFAEC